MTSTDVRLQNTPVIPGCVPTGPREARPDDKLRTQTRNTETSAAIWIPGSREDARPGMT
jgi:hypothetical protein